MNWNGVILRRNEENRKQELFEQLKSPVRDIAVEALRVVRKNEWLKEVIETGHLSAVQWSGADLSGAFLVGAKLEGADLSGADLGGAKLLFADLRGAKYNASTKWPEDFDPEKAGAVFVQSSRIISRKIR